MNFWLVLAVNSVTFGGLLFLLSAGFSLMAVAAFLAVVVGLEIFRRNLT